MGLGAIARFDHQTGAVTTWAPGENCGVHEPNFVVRPGAPEGEGYLLVIVNRLAENHSDLAILNASDIAAGPIALLTLPVRVRSTFHGMWVSENTLTTGRYVT
jgi:carotenoid cleavage dioxygenase-like enzyme